MTLYWTYTHIESKILFFSSGFLIKIHLTLYNFLGSALAL